MVTRFLREGRTVAALQHPHVVAVYGVRGGAGVSAIVMQFVEGRSLDVVLAERGRLSLPAAGLVLSQVAAGLQHAHERGIVHRDIKPANVLLDAAGRAVVSDFGIARRQGVTSITGEGMVYGTLAYMSPEQRRGEAIGPAADHYALGVMAFEVLTGRLPFTGTLAEMVRAHLHDPAPALRPLRAEVPEAVETLVLRMLEKDPAARPRDLLGAERAFRSLVPDERSTTTILAGLSQVGVKAGSEVRRAVTRPLTMRSDEPAPVPAVPVPANVPVPAAAPAAARNRRSTGLRWAGAVVALAAISTFAWIWQSRRANTQGAETPGAASAARPPASSQASPLQPGGAAATNGAIPVRRETRPAPLLVPPSDPRAGAVIRDSAPPTAATPVPVVSKTDVPPAAAPPTVSPAASSAAAPATASPAAAIGSTARLEDARAVASAFVALLNKGRWREVEQFAALEGDAATRAELVKLTRTATDFAAGFDRVASAPVPAGDAFLTEFVLELEWKGGHKLVQLRARAEKHDGAWRLAAFGASPAE
jgi:serine/threonine-protein kinase